MKEAEKLSFGEKVPLPLMTIINIIVREAFVFTEIV